MCMKKKIKICQTYDLKKYSKVITKFKIHQTYF